MFKKLALVAGLSMLLPITAHADYRWQVDGAFSRENIDVGPDDGDVDNYAIGGTFYINEVDTSKGPLGEAAFLDQSSFISAGYLYTDLDDIVEDLDGDTYGINGRYVLPLERFSLIFEAGWERQTPDFSDIDNYSLGFGAYVTPNTTVVLTYRTNDVDDSDVIDAGDIDAYEIAVEHLWDLEKGAIKLRGSYGLISVSDNDINDGDDIDTWNIGGTWYVNDTLGFGVDYSRFDNFGIEEDTYGVNVEWFVRENIGLTLGYAHSEVDDVDVESDKFVLAGEFRF